MLHILPVENCAPFMYPNEVRTNVACIRGVTVHSVNAHSKYTILQLHFKSGSLRARIPTRLVASVASLGHFSLEHICLRLTIT